MVLRFNQKLRLAGGMSSVCQLCHLRGLASAFKSHGMSAVQEASCTIDFKCSSIPVVEPAELLKHQS